MQPGNDFINQAIDEVIAVLTDSPLFMSPDATDAPEDAVGSIVYVEADLPETTNIRKDRLPHASVVYLSHGDADDGTVDSTDYTVEIGIRLYHRGTDRKAVWSALQQAAAAITAIVEQQAHVGQFGGFATLARDRGGRGIDTEEESGFGAALATGITLTISHMTPS